MKLVVFSKDFNGLEQVEDFDCDEWSVMPGGELILSREGKPLVAFAPRQWNRAQEAAE